MYNAYITGASGYIGKKLYNHLFIEPNINLLACSDLKDGRDAKSYYVEKADVIFHLAGQSGAIPSMQDPINDAEQNIMTTLRMIVLANSLGARLIFPTSGASKEPESPYGLSKKTCEEYIKMLCNDYVILRLSSVFGEKPRGVVDTFIRERRCMIYGDGNAIRDFVHVNDIVEALTIARTAPCGEYEIGSGKGVKVIDIATATGKQIKFEPKREGEKERVVLENTLPGWSPKVDVINYIKEQCKK